MDEFCHISIVISIINKNSILDYNVFDKPLDDVKDFILAYTTDTNSSIDFVKTNINNYEFEKVKELLNEFNYTTFKNLKNIPSKEKFQYIIITNPSITSKNLFMFFQKTTTDERKKLYENSFYNYLYCYPSFNKFVSEQNSLRYQTISF